MNRTHHSSKSFAQKAGDTLLAFVTALLYVIAMLFVLAGLIALTKDGGIVPGLLCFVVGLLLCLLNSLAEIRRTLQRHVDRS